MFEIVIEGKPQGKDRPRFNTRTKRTYTTKKTSNYEHMIASAWLERYGREKVGGYLYLAVYAYFPLNKNDTRKTKENKLLNKLRPDKKPDADNILKVVADALNGVAYEDDKQITAMYCRKLYSDRPHIRVFIDTDAEDEKNEKRHINN